MERMLNAIRLKLLKATAFSVAADIATTKGMRDSFLGITVHFWDAEKGVKCYALHMATMSERHTALNIRRVMLEHITNLRLPETKTFRVITDGARNMTAAFVNPFYPQNIEGEETIIPEQDIVIAEPNFGDFERLERLYGGETIADVEIPQFQIGNNTVCAAHRLQLVVKDVFEGNVAFKQTREVKI